MLAQEAAAAADTTLLPLDALMMPLDAIFITPPRLLCHYAIFGAFRASRFSLALPPCQMPPLIFRFVDASRFRHAAADAYATSRRFASRYAAFRCRFRFLMLLPFAAMPLCHMLPLLFFFSPALSFRHASMPSCLAFFSLLMLIFRHAFSPLSPLRFRLPDCFQMFHHDAYATPIFFFSLRRFAAATLPLSLHFLRHALPAMMPVFALRAERHGALMRRMQRACAKTACEPSEACFL